MITYITLHAYVHYNDSGKNSLSRSVYIYIYKNKDTLVKSRLTLLNFTLH